MKKEKIIISYSDLKAIHSQVIEFAIEKANWYNTSNVKTRIEEDLGLYGLDNEAFLIDFSERFGVDLEKMEYEKFLTPEHEVANGKWILFLPFLLLYLLCKKLIRLIILPFSQSISVSINDYDLPIIRKSNRKDLTLGDLMVSTIKKEFTEKKNIKIELKTA